MDRLAELTTELSSVLEQLHDEAADRDLGGLMAPLAWLDEANVWLKYEMVRMADPNEHDPVPFTYIPVEPRR